MNTIPVGLCTSLPLESRPSVLVVDDDPILLQALPAILMRGLADITIETCESARLAAEKAGCNHYDVVLTDLTMPGFDGLQLIAHIRERRPCTWSVLLTGRKDPTLAERAFSEGALDFIAKPFNPGVVTHTISQAIKMHQIRRRLDTQKIHVRQLREALDQKEKYPTLRRLDSMDSSRSWAPVSFDRIEQAINRTRGLIDRTEEKLRRHEQRIREDAGQRLRSDSISL